MHRQRPLIFLTVGTQRPFPRLVRAVDAIAPMLEERGFELFGQILETPKTPLRFATVPLLSNQEISQRFADAFLVVAHAGMGTILNCQMLGKAGVFMPRKGALGEQFNDHQVSTAEAFRGRPGIAIVDDEAELADAFADVHPSNSFAFTPMAPTASPEFLDRLRDIIEA
jgi:UDP-N-acetylglucosamine transferase subunit ALG13